MLFNTKSTKMFTIKITRYTVHHNNNTSPVQQYEKIQLEVEILRSLRHKHIVKYLGTSLQEGLVFIFMDYISGGSLQSVLKRWVVLMSYCIAGKLDE